MSGHIKFIIDFDRVRKLLNDGYSIEEVSKILGIKYSCLYQRIKKSGFHEEFCKIVSRRSPEIEAEYVRTFKKLKSIRKVAKRLWSAPYSICLALDRAGIPHKHVNSRICSGLSVSRRDERLSFLSKLVDFAHKGFSTGEISRRLGVSRQYVDVEIKKNGIVDSFRKKRSEFKKEKKCALINKITDAVLKYDSFDKASKKLGVSKNTVFKFCDIEAKKIIIRSRYERMSFENDIRREKISEKIVNLRNRGFADEYIFKKIGFHSIKSFRHFVYLQGISLNGLKERSYYLNKCYRKNKSIIDTYKKVRSFCEAAKILSRSPSSIHQIIQRYRSLGGKIHESQNSSHL